MAATSKVPLLVVVTLLVSCREQGPDTSRIERLSSPSTGLPSLKMAAMDMSPAGFPTAGPAALAYTPAEEQKLVRSGSLRIRVDSAEQAVALTNQIASQRGGHVADLRLSQDDAGRHDATLVIRVPDRSYDETLRDLGGLGIVRSRASTTHDITEAYADLGIRLAVKQETAARIRRLLTVRTDELSDLLEAERSLDRVVTEIELLKRKQRAYDHQVTLSRIDVAFFEPGVGLGSRHATPLRQAFGRSLEALATSTAWLVYLGTFLVPWLALASLGWWIVRGVRLRHRAA